MQLWEQGKIRQTDDLPGLNPEEQRDERIAFITAMNDSRHNNITRRANYFMAKRSGQKKATQASDISREHDEGGGARVVPRAPPPS